MGADRRPPPFRPAPATRAAAVFPFYLDLGELLAAHWAGLGLAAAAAVQTLALIARPG